MGGAGGDTARHGGGLRLPRVPQAPRGRGCCGSWSWTAASWRSCGCWTTACCWPCGPCSPTGSRHGECCPARGPPVSFWGGLSPLPASPQVPGAVPRPAGLGAEPEPAPAARRQRPPALHRRAAAALLGGAGGSLQHLHLPPAPRAPLEEDPLPGRVLLHRAPRCLRPAAVPVGGSTQRVTAALGARLKNPFLCQKLSGDLLFGMRTPPPRPPRSVPRNAAPPLPRAEPRGALCPPRGVRLPVG